MWDKPSSSSLKDIVGKYSGDENLRLYLSMY